MSEQSWRFTPEVVEDALERVLEKEDAGLDEGRNNLRRAMRYAVFSGGKRLRSNLVLEAASVAGGPSFDATTTLPAACSLELIHAYSLVHDDLPAMDNADTRRGQPSCHRAFDEATAILAGDALLTLAFEVLADAKWSGEHTRRVLKLVAQAAGEAGMVGGQATDVAWSQAQVESVSGDALLQMHALKTGALIRAASEIGAVLGGGTDEQVAALREYGTHLGRAFQIADDLLDATGDPQQTGKDATDEANGKITATAIYGVEHARNMAKESCTQALRALEVFGAEADILRRLAYFVVERQK